MTVLAAMIAFFILVTIVFAAVAIFLPEWLGITGKKAKEIMQHQVHEPDAIENHPPKKEQ